MSDKWRPVCEARQFLLNEAVYMLRYTTDRARPGLVALYDIRAGNGAGQLVMSLK